MNRQLSCPVFSPVSQKGKFSTIHCSLSCSLTHLAPLQPTATATKTATTMTMRDPMQVPGCPLPGWMPVWSRSKSRWYFHNKETKENKWTLPSESTALVHEQGTHAASRDGANVFVCWCVCVRVVRMLCVCVHVRALVYKRVSTCS